MTSTMLTAALDLAANGWRVLPCIEHAGTSEKAPYLVHGFHDASDDAERVTRWWSRWPNAMIGAVVPDSVVVLDIDPRNGGSYESLVEVLGLLPDTLTAWSGRGDGGRHLYYRRPTGELSSHNIRNLGVDLKKSGYCIVPPSVHPATGEPYRWAGDTINELPVRARAKLRRPKPKPGPVYTHSGAKNAAGLLAFLDRFPEQGINDALSWAAGAAAKDNHPETSFQALIDRAVLHGESRRQAEKTVASARSWVARGCVRA